MLIFSNILQKRKFLKVFSKNRPFSRNVETFGNIDQTKIFQRHLKQVTFPRFLLKWSQCWYLRIYVIFRIRGQIKNVDVLWWCMKVWRLRNTRLFENRSLQADWLKRFVFSSWSRKYMSILIISLLLIKCKIPCLR